MKRIVEKFHHLLLRTDQPVGFDAWSAGAGVPLAASGILRRRGAAHGDAGTAE
jgi:hypothetical protein